MSVFGGDSWAREAQHRKRRVDDLAIEGLEGSSYKRLSNGKFACLVCPNCPVLDSPVMLSVSFISPSLSLSVVDDDVIIHSEQSSVIFYLRIRYLISYNLLMLSYVNATWQTLSHEQILSVVL